MPRYRAAVMVDGKKTWLDWMEGLYRTDGCGDTFTGIEGVGIVDFEIEPGWGKWEIDDEDGGAGNDCDQVDMVELMISPC